MGNITPSAFIELCRQMAPQVEAQASITEERRRLSPDTLDALARADAWWAMVPTTHGGAGLDLATLCQGARILGQACASTAWTTTFFWVHTWMVGFLPDAGRAELFADGPPLVAAPLAPTGTATPLDGGGYQLSGRWEWATGIEHANWVMVHALVAGEGFRTRFFVVPRSQVEVDDVWHTSGMRGTGSNTVRLDEVVVPEQRTVGAARLLQAPEPRPGDPLSSLPLGAVLALSACSVAMGAAEAALASYRERLAERVLAYSLGDKAAEQPAAQIRLAAATDVVASARARWEQAIDDVAEAGRTGVPSDAARADARLAAASTVRSARRAVEVIAEGAGASVYFTSHPLQRIQRDLETLKGHVVFDWDRSCEIAGRVALGLPLRPTDLA